MRSKSSKSWYVVFDEITGVQLTKHTSAPTRCDGRAIVRFGSSKDYKAAFINDISLNQIEDFGGQIVE